MKNQSLLQSIDTLFVSHGLAGLNNVQLTVLESTLAGESYPEIAARSTYTVKYLREVGSRLWQLLSNAVGEPVNKKNIKSVLQRYQQSLVVEGLEHQYFWGEAIDVSVFYDRTQELKTLGKWITKDRCRLIEILAMVCPITSNIKGFNLEVILPDGLNTTGVILAFQVKTVDWVEHQIRYVRIFVGRGNG